MYDGTLKELNPLLLSAINKAARLVRRNGEWERQCTLIVTMWVSSLTTCVVLMVSSASGCSAAKSKAAKTPKSLSLKEKYDVIETSNKNPGLAVRATKFGCGRSQINSILKNKESIVELYESIMSSTSVLSRERCRESDFSEVNEALYSWYLLATQVNPSSVKKQSKSLINWIFLISKPQMVGW